MLERVSGWGVWKAADENINAAAAIPVADLMQKADPNITMACFSSLLLYHLFFREALQPHLLFLISSSFLYCVNPVWGKHVYLDSPDPRNKLGVGPFQTTLIVGFGCGCTCGTVTNCMDKFGSNCPFYEYSCTQVYQAKSVQTTKWNGRNAKQQSIEQKEGHLKMIDRFDAALKFVLLFALPPLFALWLGFSIAGSVLGGVGYGFFAPWLSTFEAFRHDRDSNKFSHCIMVSFHFA